MFRLNRLLPAALSLLAAAPLPAQAALLRVWVSGKGTDSPGCGALVSPCRQIKYALDNGLVAPGGEIDILDPAGFTPFTISQDVSILNDNVGTASVQQTAIGGSAITINGATATKVTLKGLSVDGGGAAFYGVRFASALPDRGGDLNILNCLVKNFDDTGILIQPTRSGSGAMTPFNVLIADSTLIGTRNNGLYIASQFDVVATIYNSTLKNNGYAISLTADASVKATIDNNRVVDNGRGLNRVGIMLTNGAQATIKRSTVLGNTATDVSVGGGSTAYLYDHNTIGSLGNSGVAYTDGTNNINQKSGSLTTKLPE